MSVIESKFTFFDMQIECTFMNATELGQSGFRNCPEVFNTINMVNSLSKFILSMFDSMMLFIPDINQAIICLKAIGKHNRFFTDLVHNNRHKLCGRRGAKVGVVAVLLALTSPIMLKFASSNMLEAMGATLFLGAVYLSVVSEERKITIEYIFLVLLLADARAVEVDDMQVVHAQPCIAFRESLRVHIIVGDAIKIAVAQTHAVAVVQIDCRDQFHVSMSRKLARNRAPVFAERSG